MILEVGPQKEKRFVSFFAMGYLGDMPQQQDGAGFLRQNATYGCRCCVIPKDLKGDLQYDVVSNGRYHHEVVLARNKAANMRGTKTFFKNLGMSETPSPLTILSPALDLITFFGPDSPHSEWGGIFKLMHELLFTNILAANSKCSLHS